MSIFYFLKRVWTSDVHILLSGVLGLFSGLFPSVASAHEVYVLSPETIARDLASSSPNPLVMIAKEPRLFLFYGMVGIILVSTVFAMSITRILERTFNPILNSLKPWAAPIARITLGICLIASAYHKALFGPELPLSEFGDLASLLQLALYLTGTLCLIGFWTRPAGVVALGIFLVGIARYNVYMLTYSNYLGEILFAIFLGGGRLSLDNLLCHHKSFFHSITRRLEPYAFPTLRILFGISILYAPYYAKFVHSQLALDVVTNYHLTDFFHFEPLFVVLGALIVESLIGLFLIFGLEIRHTALFFLFWIFLSLLYFGEAVWPHLVLIGVLISLFCHGYDRFSLEGRYFKYHAREPVL